jgi:signal peptidase I
MAVVMGALGILFFVFGYHVGMVEDPRGFGYVHALSDKMSPTIEPGDWVLVDREVTSKDAVKRGDIVWFLKPGEQEEEGKQFLRVAGLAGESVSFSASGELQINGEHFTRHPKLAERDFRLNGKTPEPVHLGGNEFYLLGDNRAEARDSRSFGPIPIKSLRGRALSILFPPNRTGQIDEGK